MSYSKRFVVILIALLIAIPSVNAYDDNRQSSKQFKPYTKFSVGMSYRTDEHKSLNHSPTGHLSLYGFLFPGLAMKIGVGFNLGTELEGRNEDAREFHFESGFRFQRMEKSISPYFELGVNVINYNFNRTGSETLVGFGVALGGEIKIGPSTFLDLSLRHIANKQEDIYFTDCPSCEIYYSYYTYNSLYNPTTVKAAINFNL